ncbi:MAG TPA: hypothetical protein PLX89_19425 [Verrucomicrobiota bacterium]|nr:hypothetical protein [Verrucomicrobiales bacterium]HRI15172.1 hypothetical protein [Verrucomicrobiota bacterium]
MHRAAVTLRGLAVFLTAIVLSGCGKSPDSASSGHGHDHSHGHTPKYGGVLVELGHHENNLEFVLDQSAGKLTAYVLDAHAENFVRLPVESFVVEAKVEDAPQTLTFRPVGNAATGEKPGDTSQFEATADWLKTAPKFSGKVVLLPIKSEVYRDVEFSLPNP